MSLSQKLFTIIVDWMIGAVGITFVHVILDFANNVAAEIPTSTPLPNPSVFVLLMCAVLYGGSLALLVEFTIDIVQTPKPPNKPSGGFRMKAALFLIKNPQSAN